MDTARRRTFLQMLAALLKKRRRTRLPP